MMTIQHIIARMRADPVLTAASISAKQLGELLQEASDTYYNTGTARTNLVLGA